MELKIDIEFQSKIPPLTGDELFALQQSIMQEGRLISPIVVWNGVIVDGHNRYNIIRNHPEIKYEIYEKEFDDRNDAIVWICKNQLGRRNLTPEQKKYLIGKQYEAEKASHGADHFQGNQYAKVVSGQNDHSPKMTTRERIAKETDTSESYVRRAEEYANAVDLAEEAVPGIKGEILSGKLSATNAEIIKFNDTAPELRAAYAENLRLPRKKKTRKKRATGVIIPEDAPTMPKRSKIDRLSIEDELSIIVSALDYLMLKWGDVLKFNRDRIQEAEFFDGMCEYIDELYEYLELVEEIIHRSDRNAKGACYAENE